MMDKNFEDFDDYLAGQPSLPWLGSMSPSYGSFSRSYADFSEAQLLARWLAGRSGQVVDLHLVEGNWHFTEKALRSLDSLYEANDDEANYLEARLERASEHWEINKQYYSDRLQEDSDWGRDNSGRPYAFQE